MFALTVAGGISGSWGATVVVVGAGVVVLVEEEVVVVKEVLLLLLPSPPSDSPLFDNVLMLATWWLVELTIPAVPSSPNGNTEVILS